MIRVSDFAQVETNYFSMGGKAGTYQRLGQWLCNQFNITDSEIFYEEDDCKASRMFTRKYVQ